MALLRRDDFDALCASFAELRTRLQERTAAYKEYNFLVKLKPLQKASHEALQRLVGACVPRQVAAGETVQRKGVPSEGLHFVLAGKLQVSRNDDGGTRQMDTVPKL